MLSDTTDTRPVIILMCGPPGSGKTTLRHRLFKQFPVVSADDLILELAAKDGTTYSRDFQKYKKRATDLYNEAMGTLFFFKKSFIVDRININVSSRKVILDQATGYRKVAIYFPAMPIDTLMRRIEKRERETGQGVPRDAVTGMLASYTIPTLEEGFDQVINANEI